MFDRLIEGFRFCIKGLVDAPCVRMMQQFPQHGDVSTLEHCLTVAFISYLFCRILGLNFYAAARGGLLHDLFLYDWHKPNPYPGLHGFSHPKIALQNARKFFLLTPLEEEIIRCHMWPLTFWTFPKHGESFVVSCADKCCALLETFGWIRYFRSTETFGWIREFCCKTAL